MISTLDSRQQTRRSVRHHLRWKEMVAPRLVRDATEPPPVSPLPNWLVAAWIVLTAGFYLCFMFGLL